MAPTAGIAHAVSLSALAIVSPPAKAMLTRGLPKNAWRAPWDRCVTGPSGTQLSSHDSGNVYPRRQRPISEPRSFAEMPSAESISYSRRRMAHK